MGMQGEPGALDQIQHVEVDVLSVSPGDVVEVGLINEIPTTPIVGRI